MSESKHTPGPLEISPSQTGSGRSFVITKNGMRIALFEYEADAALFAAASELLEALKNLHAAYVCGADETGYVTDVGFMNIDAIVEAARAAIAKAEGGQP